MKFYFRLQLKRFYRKSSEWGINPYWGASFIVLAFCGLSYLFFSKVPYPPYFYSFTGFALIFQLGTVNRNEFLKNIFSQRDYQSLRLTENILLGLPFALFLTTRRQYSLALLILLIGWLCSFFNRVNRSSRVIPSPFSRRPFEFTIGFRNTFWIAGLLYILVFISIRVANFNLGIAAMAGLFLVCMNFYSNPEPLFYVWVFSTPAPIFIRKKIVTALVYSFFFCLPMVSALLICYPLKLLIILTIFNIGHLYVILFVLAKYTNYPHEMELSKMLELSICFVAPPALVLVIPHFYTESLKKLKTYLK